MGKVAPCKGCGDRKLGCHTHCEAYKEWKNGVDEITAARVREQNAKPQICKKVEKQIWKEWKK